MSQKQPYFDLKHQKIKKIYLLFTSAHFATSEMEWQLLNSIIFIYGIMFIIASNDWWKYIMWIA